MPPRETLFALTVDYEDNNYAQFSSPSFTLQSIISYSTFEELLSKRGIPLPYQMVGTDPKLGTLGIPNLSIEVLGPSQKMLNNVLKRLKQLKGEEDELIEHRAHIRTQDSLKKIDLELTSLYDRKGDAINDTSIIVKITYKQASFLFTGDAEIASLVTKKGGKLPYRMRKNIREKMRNVNVLKAPHHGSENGIDTSGRILDLIQPKNVVITAKAMDTGHPYPELLEQLKERRIPYFLTTRNHDGIVIITNGSTELDFGNANEGGNNPIEEIREKS